MERDEIELTIKTAGGPYKSGESFYATIRGQNIMPLYLITPRRHDLKPLPDRSLECDRSYSLLPIV
jgi:hypothetical protein